MDLCNSQSGFSVTSDCHLSTNGHSLSEYWINCSRRRFTLMCSRYSRSLCKMMLSRKIWEEILVGTKDWDCLSVSLMDLNGSFAFRVCQEFHKRVTEPRFFKGRTPTFEFIGLAFPSAKNHRLATVQYGNPVRLRSLNWDSYFHVNLKETSRPTLGQPVGCWQISDWSVNFMMSMRIFFLYIVSVCSDFSAHTMIKTLFS